MSAGKSSVLLDVKPWDDETDMVKLEEAVRHIKLEGLLWGACMSQCFFNFYCSFVSLCTLPVFWTWSICRPGQPSSCQLGMASKSFKSWWPSLMISSQSTLSLRTTCALSQQMSTSRAVTLSRSTKYVSFFISFIISWSCCDGTAYTQRI